MLTKGEEYEKRDDNLTYWKIGRMKSKSRRMIRIKKKNRVSGRKKELISRGMKMLIKDEAMTG